MECSQVTVHIWPVFPGSCELLFWKNGRESEEKRLHLQIYDLSVRALEFQPGLNFLEVAIVVILHIRVDELDYICIFPQFTKKKEERKHTH